jgi:predicted permease
MFDAWRDLRYAVRTLLTNRGFSAIAILTLALGIGANTAVFTIVDQTLLRSAPFAFANRLVDVNDYNRTTQGGGSSLTPEKIIGWQGSPLFERFEGYAPRTFDLTGDGAPERPFGLLVTTGLFPMLGVQPLLGRNFAAGDGAAGSPRVVLIADGLWRRRFGGDAAALGRTLMLDDEPHTVIGVMPRRFHLLGGSAGTDDALWVPLDVAHPGSEAGVGQFYGIGRLSPGVSAAAAQTRADLLATEYQKARPLPRTWDLRIKPKLVTSVTPTGKTTLLVLLGAVGLVLLIACVNVTNLFLSRAVARERELAIRAAIGASRSRLIRGVLTEAIVLAAAGGLLGVLLAEWGVDAVLAAAAPANLTFMTTTTVEIDGRVLAVTLFVTLATAVLVGLVPALRASRPNLEPVLRVTAPGRNGHRSIGTPGGLVIAEVALALMLLVGAALMTRTFARLHAVDPGFDARSVATVAVALPSDRYPTDAARFEFFDQLSRRVAALPGVSDVAATQFFPPPRVGGISTGIEADESQVSGNRELTAQSRVTGPYFRALRIPLMEGRTFEDHESPDSMIVNKAMVDRFWPGRAGVGRRIRFGPNEPWKTVVGVVGNVELRPMRISLQTYLPFVPRAAAVPGGPVRPGRRTYSGRTLIVRAADVNAIVAAIGDQLSAIDRSQPIGPLIPLEDAWDDAFAVERFVLLLMSVFSGIAVVLAAAGIFAVVSQMVAQRTREIGVRVALGAAPRDIVRMILSRGLLLTVSGLAIGGAGALALTRLLRSLLFEVSPYDPLSFAVVSLMLMAVGLLACWLPTYRAMRIEPAVALRAE